MTEWREQKDRMEEKIREALNSIHIGQPIECTMEDYHNGLRAEIQKKASAYIDRGDAIRGMIALQEVRPLDNLYPKVAKK